MVPTRNVSGQEVSQPDRATQEDALAGPAGAGGHDVPATCMDPDAEDVAAFRGGDERAFARLVVKYQTRVFNVAYRMLNRREEAEELAQEIFLQVYRQGSSFRGDSLFSTWLFQVALNLCRNRLKYLKRRRAQLHDSLDQPIETSEGRIPRSIPDASHLPEDEVARAQLRRLCAEQIAELPDEYREIIILRDINGLSYEEIAEILSLAEGTVKSRLHRARMELRERLLPHCDRSLIE
jgi:RNA polymerase sigma-70 factor (ECF subfamily)